jgi:hypothetical protein
MIRPINHCSWPFLCVQTHATHTLRRWWRTQNRCCTRITEWSRLREGGLPQTVCIELRSVRVGTMPRSSPAPSRSFLIVEFRLCREDSTTTGALARRPPSRGAAARRRCGDAAAATAIHNFSFGGANSSRRDGRRPLNRSDPAGIGSSAISRDEASSSSPPSLPPGTSSSAVAASAETAASARRSGRPDVSTTLPCRSLRLSSSIARGG